MSRTTSLRVLGNEQTVQIVEVQLRDLQRRLAKRKLALDLTSEAEAQLAERRYAPSSGRTP